MKFFKQFSVSLVALAAATAATAATQPFTTPTSSTITVDIAAVNASLAGYSIAATGGASWNGTTGVLSNPIQSLSTPANNGALLVEYGDTSGLRFSKAFSPTITLQNFSFDLATNTLYGDLIVGSLAFPTFKVENQSVLTAGSVTSTFGSGSGTSVANSTTARALNLNATNFALSDSFKEYLTVRELDPAAFAYIGNMIKTVNVTSPTPAVPEPSTYALMGVGLVGIAALSRRRAAK